MDNYTVVIAEDNDLIREMYNDMIARIHPNWEVYSFETAEAAMHGLPSKVDCIITDYDLGIGLTGLDFARLAKQRMPNAPVYLVSGSVDRTEEFTLAQREGVIQKFIPKPVRTRTLIEMISRT